MKEDFTKEKEQLDLIDSLQNNSNKCHQIIFHFLRVTNLFGKIGYKLV